MKVIRLSTETRDIIQQWGLSASEAVRKCLRRYNRKQWPLKQHKGKSHPIPVTVPESLLGALLSWEVRAIVEDYVKAEYKNHKPIVLDIATEDLEACPEYSANYPWEQPGIEYEMEQADG